VLEQGWARMTVRETLPPLEGMTLDSLGYLWVLRPSGMPHDPLTVDVFDPDGRFIGDLSVPGGLRPRPAPVIGADYLMGVWADELDVETVRVYRLERDR
jgi:sugar lactone lactonase YvrE